MSSTRRTSASPRSQRRRDEIVDAASTRFAELGYFRVGMDDVAADVGITGGAIYKHFGGKQDLLARAVDGALSPTEAVLAEATDLRQAVVALAELTTGQRRIGLLLTREVRALEGDRAQELRQRIEDVRIAVAGLIAARHPEQSALDARLLADAVLALLCSPAHHTVSLPRARSVALLAAMADQVADTELPVAAPVEAKAVRADGGRTASLVDRRDQLIDAAVDLFGRRGYWAATMDDLGAAADIAGPSIYQHFPSKADLLVAVFTRGNEGLRLGLSRAFAEGHDPASTLLLLVDSYVDFVLGHPGVNRLLMNEALYLPELERASIRGLQHRYVGEWVNLLQETHPGLDELTARFTTHAVLSVVNNRGRPQPEHGNRLHEVLLLVSRNLLLTPVSAEVTP